MIQELSQILENLASGKHRKLLLEAIFHKLEKKKDVVTPRMAVLLRTVATDEEVQMAHKLPQATFLELILVMFRLINL